MTTNAVTSSAAHATLEDLGYKTCKAKGTDHKGYRWMGRKDCPRCNPAKMPRVFVPVGKGGVKKIGQGTVLSRKNHKNRRLSDDQVIEARRLYWIEDWSDAQLAQKYGLNPSTMHGAVTNQSYKDLPMPPEEVRQARKERKKQASRKTFCSQGHEIAKVGRSANGMCKECQRQYNKNRYERNKGE